MKIVRILISAATLVVLFTVDRPAGAASPCPEEQLRYCGHLVNKDKHRIAACFIKHMDRFTLPCREAARTVIRNINESEFCRADFNKFCDYDGPIPPPEADIANLFPCLIKNYEDFAPACQGYLDKNIKEMAE